MMDTICLAVGPIILIFMVWMGISGRNQEKKEWNGGICRESGLPWISFDQDSQGGRGYTTTEGTAVSCCWISWPRVDKRAPAEEG